MVIPFLYKCGYYLATLTNMIFSVATFVAMGTPK